ncbi:MAG TPA: hypothetical protein VFO77_01330 [Actinoplanes sp.]|nr:hypothetical protein [Actinoplanes sp.]
MSTTYRVVATREGTSWLADAPDVPGAHTWAKNLPSLDRSIREAIALALDLPDDAEADMVLTWEYRLGDPAIEELTSQLRAERRRLQEAEATLTSRTASVAQQLVEQLPVRDVACLLAITPQRVSQVAPTSGRDRAAS